MIRTPLSPAPEVSGHEESQRRGLPIVDQSQLSFTAAGDSPSASTTPSLRVMS